MPVTCGFRLNIAVRPLRESVKKKAGGKTMGLMIFVLVVLMMLLLSAVIFALAKISSGDRKREDTEQEIFIQRAGK